MKKYYSRIGTEHHRFCAINQYAANEIAKSRAKSMGVMVWSEPVVYCPNVHGEYFWEYVA